MTFLIPAVNINHGVNTKGIKCRMTWGRISWDLEHNKQRKGIMQGDHLCVMCTWCQYHHSYHSFACIHTLRPRQDGRHFSDAIFMCILFNENCCILIKFSLKYIRKGPIDNNRTLVQIMAWRQSGDKPVSEPMMISLPMHICVTRPQWVNTLRLEQNGQNCADDIQKMLHLDSNYRKIGPNWQ